MPRRKTPYRSKVVIGHEPSGKPIHKWIQGRTRAELAAAREHVLIAFVTGEAPVRSPLFGEYACEWYNLRKKPFVSASSRQSYRTALNRDILPVFATVHLRAVTAAELQEFVNRFADRSATKITVVLAVIRGIFSAAIADRLIDVNPAAGLKRPKSAPPAPKAALTPEQRARIAEVCKSSPYLAVLYYLGVRPGEARGLQWRDIDFDTRLVSIERDIDYKAGKSAGALKTEASKRTIPLPAPLVPILKPLRDLPANYVIHGKKPSDPLAKASGERLWVQLMAAAEMVRPATEKERKSYRVGDIRSQWRSLITPHVLRHNYITMCWENGFDAFTTMKLVGHTSIKTTMDIYTHMSRAQMAKVATQLDTMFEGCTKVASPPAVASIQNEEKAQTP